MKKTFLGFAIPISLFFAVTYFSTVYAFPAKSGIITIEQQEQAIEKKANSIPEYESISRNIIDLLAQDPQMDKSGYIMTDLYLPSKEMVKKLNKYFDTFYYGEEPVAIGCQYKTDKKNSYRVLLQVHDPKAAAQQHQFAEEKIKNFVLSIKEEKPNEQAKQIHDWLIEKFNYDYTLKNFSPYSGLSGENTVCQGYSVAYFAACSYAGLPCKIVSGENHAWNRIEIEGTWKSVDVTWDDIGDSTDYFLFNEAGSNDHKVRHVDNAY